MCTGAEPLLLGELGGSALAAGGAGASAGAAGIGSAMGAAAAAAVASGVVGQLMAPDAPEAKKALEMPDPLAQEAARRREIAETMSRRGRASTIMTEPSGGKLGG